MIEESGLREKDRIVWISDNGPEFGEVKWIGILPDSNRRDITVGVEFENPVGSGTGKYKNHRLFYAKAQHASLVPIMGLMKADVYMEMNQGAGAFGAGYQPDYGIFQEPELINSPRSSQTRSAQQNVVQSYNPIQREILPNPVISPERGSYSSNSSSSSHQLMLSKDQIQVHLPPLSPKEKLPRLL